MRKTIKRLSLEAIVLSMDEVRMGIQLDAAPEKVKANSEAMRDLAEAYTLVKRGVMMPDYGRDKYDK